MTKAEDLIRKYIRTGHMMQLASLSGKQPWICTLYYVADDELNLYWASLPTRRHSQEITAHSSVAVAIPVQFQQGKKVIGLQIEAKATQLTGADIAPAAQLYAERFGRDATWVDDIARGKTEHRMYRCTPELIVLFDEQHFPHNTRIEWRP